MTSSQHDCDQVPQRVPLEVKRDQSQRISRSLERNSRVHHPDVFRLDGVCARFAAEYRDLGYDAPARCTRLGAGIPRWQQETLSAAWLVLCSILHRARHYAGPESVAMGLGGDSSTHSGWLCHRPLAQLECGEGTVGVHGCSLLVHRSTDGRLLAQASAGDVVAVVLDDWHVFPRHLWRLEARLRQYVCPLELHHPQRYHRLALPALKQPSENDVIITATGIPDGSFFLSKINVLF